MKVYELMQKLCQCNADDEVNIKFTLNWTLDCPHCENDFDKTLSDTVNIDSTDYKWNLGEFNIIVKD